MVASLFSSSCMHEPSWTLVGSGVRLGSPVGQLEIVRRSPDALRGHRWQGGEEQERGARWIMMPDWTMRCKKHLLTQTQILELEIWLRLALRFTSRVVS